ncbi:MAG: hypothetical protein GYB65_09290 [Chloroflexi bacterium]|nr:hypothetical protein [Chloroflexota bacterium]
MQQFRKRKTADPTARIVERLEGRVASWEKLAASAKTRDEGPQAGLRECRPYPEGYWTGVSYGLEVAINELRDVIEQLKS